MTIRLLDQLVAFGLALFGAYLIWAGQQFGFMQGTTPGSGFFPVIMGVLLVVLSLVNLGRSLLGVEHIGVDMSRGEVLKFAGIVVAMLVYVLLIELLGITIATMLLMVAIGVIIRPILERGFLLRLGVASILVPLVCRLVFGNLLRVPLPLGPFGF